MGTGLFPGVGSESWTTWLSDDAFAVAGTPPTGPTPSSGRFAAKRFATWETAPAVEMLKLVATVPIGSPPVPLFELLCEPASVNPVSWGETTAAMSVAICAALLLGAEASGAEFVLEP